MRHYPAMPPNLRKDDNLLVKPCYVKDAKRVVYKLAEPACWLGFNSLEIKLIINISPDYYITRVALLHARKPYYFQYNT